MKFTKKLRILVDQDQVVQQIPDLWLKGKETDPNHVQRRMQQRAINFDMMKLAIAYGEVAFHSKAKTWTLIVALVFLDVAKSYYIERDRFGRLAGLSFPFAMELEMTLIVLFAVIESEQFS
jgi:hypothetical protein